MAASRHRAARRLESLPTKTNGSLDRVLNGDMDSRRICFEQGTAFVCVPDEDDLILAEEPNGVVEHRRISHAAVTRT